MIQYYIAAEISNKIIGLSRLFSESNKTSSRSQMISDNRTAPENDLTAHDFDEKENIKRSKDLFR